jgi:hypothetical protein
MAKRSSVVAYSRDVLALCSAFTFRNSFCYNHGLYTCDGSTARPAISHTLTVFLFFLVYFLWLSKHVWLLQCLWHSKQGIPTSSDTHGGLVIQSQHVSSHLCVASRLHPLPHALHTSSGHSTCQDSDNVIMYCHGIIQ